MRKVLIHSVSLSIFLIIFVFTTQTNAQIRNWTDDLDPNTPGVQSCMVDGVATLKCLEVVMGNILYMSNGFIILVVFVMFIYGGFIYLTSLGDQAKIEKAQGVFKFAMLGVVLYISAFLILKTIDVIFLEGKGTLFNFSLPGP